MPIAFSSKAEVLTPGFVKIVGHVERVHLQNLLKEELKGDVAKIWCCSSAENWRALMKLCAEKLTSLVSTTVWVRLESRVVQSSPRIFAAFGVGKVRKRSENRAASQPFLLR